MNGFISFSLILISYLTSLFTTHLFPRQKNLFSVFNNNQVPVLAWRVAKNGKYYCSIIKTKRRKPAVFEIFYMISTSRWEFTVCRNRKYKNDFLFSFCFWHGAVCNKMNEMVKFIVLLFSRWNILLDEEKKNKKYGCNCVLMYFFTLHKIFQTIYIQKLRLRWFLLR